MKLAKYEAYIGELESLAAKSHFRFRLRVIAIVALGYGVMAVLLLGILLCGVALGLARAIVMAARMLALGVQFGVGMCRGLWIKFEPPRGVELAPEKMQPLVSIVDELCSQLNAPKIHRVFISHDCNASAMQRPKFGPLGPCRNEVTIGLPLLALFSLAEVRGIIAHEIGHIHRGHSRFGQRVAQILSAWTNALDEIGKNRMRGKILVDIFNWYVPKLRGAQYVLKRIGEREANRAEASVVGVEVHVQACVALAVYAQFSHQAFLDSLGASFSSSTIPPDLLVQMWRSLQTPIAETTMLERVSESLAAPFDPFATHPPVSQIIREAGIDPTLESVLAIAPLPKTDRQCAGDAIYGDEFESIVVLVSAAWTDMKRGQWEKDRADFMKHRGQVDSMLETAQAAPPTDKERVDLAYRLYQLGRDDEAMKWVEPVKDVSPKSCLVYGLLLKNGKDPDWVQWVETAAKSMEIRQAASEVLIAYYTSIGDRAEVQRIAASLEDLQQFAADMRQQFRHLSSFWTYGPCKWSPEEIEKIVSELAKNKTIKRAYFASRSNGDPRFDNHCVVVEYGHGGMSAAEVSKRVLKIEYPAQCTVFTLQKAPALVSKVPGTMVYEKKRAKLLPWSRAA